VLTQAAPQFGVELDDVTTEKQILRKEQHRLDEAGDDDEEVESLLKRRERW